ncbi:MaoC/PaaZ C-terminal domain-containing protein [Sphingomonas oryzagri]
MSAAPSDTIRPLDAARLRAYRVPETRDHYDRRDTILYALGVGAGLSELDETALVFERDLLALPTMALVLGTPGFWLMDRATGLDWQRILHGEQSFRLFRPLPPEGDVIGRTTIGELSDKGPGKPAMLRCTRELSDGVTGAKLAELEEIWVLRGAGGFGGDTIALTPASPPMPDRAPDAALALPTTRNQAMLYRLTGDRNPLHVDSGTAAVGGFERPILHGLATMGVAARALVHLACGGDPRRLSAMRLRFTAPVFPGDVILTELWEEEGALRFRARVSARGVTVIDGGSAKRDGFEGE